MKKIISILLVILLICSFSVSASAVKKTNRTFKSQNATERETVEFTWEEFEQDIKESGIEGKFETLDEVNLKFWLPDLLEEEELTEEDRENGFIKYYSTEDDSAVMSVVYYDAGIKSLEEWQAELEQEPDVADIETIIVNGYYALFYDVSEDDVFCIDFSTEAGYLLEFTFYPMSDEDYQGLAALIISSLQPEE
ncbi:MAG: hypothetical protein IJG40_16390 [Oscillospiraceae bacterium]|nr:hypothetical protein [Oscillospiraceae bacterium]